MSDEAASGRTKDPWAVRVKSLGREPISRICSQGFLWMIDKQFAFSGETNTSQVPSRSDKSLGPGFAPLE